MYKCDLKNKNTLYNLYLDHRFKLNSDLKAIIEVTGPNISPELFPITKLSRNLMPVKQSFSMLRKVLVKIFAR